jgi:hypothetical protein
MRSSQLVFSSLLVASSMLVLACGGGGSSDTSASTGTGAGGSTTSSSSSTAGAGGNGGNGESTSTSGSTTSSGSTTGSGTGGGSPCGGDPVAPDYAACGGTTFFADGSCLDGSCAVDPLADRAFKEWRKQTMALSGLSAATLTARTPISTVIFENGPSSVRVRIEYVIDVDWVRSRQADTADFGNFPLATTPSDAEVTQAVKLALRNVVWTGLGAIGMVADQAKVKAALDSCSCGMPPDACNFNFQNVTGILLGRAIKPIDPANNKCLAAKVDIGKGTLLSCDMVPCAIN